LGPVARTPGRRAASADRRFALPARASTRGRRADRQQPHTEREALGTPTQYRDVDPGLGAIAQHLDQELRTDREALALTPTTSYAVRSAPDGALSAQTENLERSAEDATMGGYSTLARTGRVRPCAVTDHTGSNVGIRREADAKRLRGGFGRRLEADLLVDIVGSSPRPLRSRDSGLAGERPWGIPTFIPAWHENAAAHPARLPVAL
jgi:hypothetical protein